MKSLFRSLRIRISRTLMLLAISVSAILWSLQTYAADRAEIFVQTQIGAGHAILQNPQLSVDQRREQFRAFMLSIIDVKRVALFVAGPYATQADNDEITRYVAAYTEFTASFYGRLLDNYGGQTMRVTGLIRRNDDDAVVLAEVVDPRGGAPHRIGFRVRRTEMGEPILTDFQVEGAWLALAQRSEFTSFLQQHRGDLAQLSQELEKRARVNRGGALQSAPAS